MSARGFVVREEASLLRGRPMAVILAKRGLLTVRTRDDVTRSSDHVPPELETHRLRRTRRVSGYPVGGDMLDCVFEDGAFGAIRIVGFGHLVGVDEFGPQY